MHNDTPLGTIMYLKELERQAAQASRSPRPKAHRAWGTLIDTVSALVGSVREATGWPTGGTRRPQKLPTFASRQLP